MCLAFCPRFTPQSSMKETWSGWKESSNQGFHVSWKTGNMAVLQGWELWKIERSLVPSVSSKFIVLTWRLIVCLPYQNQLSLFVLLQFCLVVYALCNIFVLLHILSFSYFVSVTEQKARLQSKEVQQRIGLIAKSLRSRPWSRPLKFYINDRQLYSSFILLPYGCVFILTYAWKYVK